MSCNIRQSVRLLITSVERDGAEPVLLCSNTYDALGSLGYVMPMASAFN